MFLLNNAKNVEISISFVFKNQVNVPKAHSCQIIL